MTGMTRGERNDWKECWHDTRWEVYQDGAWQSLPPISVHPLMVLSAWNPGSRRLPIRVNEARDKVLQAELLAMGISHVRARGRSPDGSWCEDGWQVPYESMLAEQLLRRHGQLAAWITDAGGAYYHWTGQR